MQGTQVEFELHPYYEHSHVSAADVAALHRTLAVEAVRLRDMGCLDQARGIARAKLLVDSWLTDISLDKPTEIV